MQRKNNEISKDFNNALKRIGKNITHLMRTRAMDSQKLSLATGIGIATINNIKRGYGNPTVATLSSLADFFCVKLGELTDIELDEGSVQVTNVKTIPLIKFHEIELYLEKNASFTDRYTTEVENVNDNSLFAVEITNSALVPALDKGMLCIISQNETFCDGDIVLLKIKDYPVFFRRVFIGENILHFYNLCLEPDGGSLEYKGHEVVGVLLKTIRKFK